MRQIEIPNSVRQHTIHNFLGKCSFLLNPEDEHVEICFPSRLVFMEPFGLAMLAAFGDDAHTRNVKITLETPDVTGLAYLKRMHVFEHLRIPYPSDIKEREEAGRFIPVTKVMGDEELKHFIGSLMPILHLDETSAMAVSYCVSELVRNVLEHAGSAGAYVCAQRYQGSRVCVGVADRGRGILNSLRNNYPDMRTYREAIPFCLRPGVTGSKSFENAGAGLFFTKSLAKLSNSYFSIYSGDTCYRMLKNQDLGLFPDPLADRHNLWTGLQSWPGTVVAVDLNTEELKQFPLLLSDISQVYQTTRTPKPRRKIRFT
jgi:hypothetical protein